MWTKFSSRFSQHLSYFHIWYNVESYMKENLVWQMLKRVIIDAGHGGEEPGAMYDGRGEKTIPCGWLLP